jgi:hypothetical protein
MLFPRAGFKLLSCGARNVQYQRVGFGYVYYLWAKVAASEVDWRPRLRGCLMHSCLGSPHHPLFWL